MTQITQTAAESRPGASLRRLAKLWLWRASPALFARTVRRQSQEFSIGIYRGSSFCELKDDSRVNNPVLTSKDVTDIPAGFVADPFMVRVNGVWHMFFEAMDLTNFKGCIAYAVSTDAIHWEYRAVVLAESFHLAYPQVFEWNSEYYMLPDAPDQGVLLYRAVEFPTRWELCSRLLEEPAYSDSSIFKAAGCWWMLTFWRGAEGSALKLFHAQCPAGPWTEHPSSPIVRDDDRISRPAGRPVVVDGIPIRFAQDCSTVYGEQVWAFAMTSLDFERYEERPISDRPILHSGSAAWHRSGMHHLDPHRLSDREWVACVDGW